MNEMTDTQSGTARMLAALIALVAWTGLAIQLNATTALRGSVVMAIWVVLRYFTVVANVLTAVFFTGIAVGAPPFSRPRWLAGLTLAMMLVGVVYTSLLRGLIDLSGGAALANLLLHFVTPILVPIYWLAFARKGALHNRDALLWLLFPFAYGVYALIRGGLGDFYAYPFMDVSALGWPQVIFNGSIGALCFIAAGYAFIWLDHRLGQRSRN
jgi:hypothetical protein